MKQQAMISMLVFGLGVSPACVGDVTTEESVAMATENLGVSDAAAFMCSEDGEVRVLAALARLRERSPSAPLPSDEQAVERLASVCADLQAVAAAHATTNYLAIVYIAAHIDGAIGYAVYDLDAIRRRDREHVVIAEDIRRATGAFAGRGGLATLGVRVHLPSASYDGAGLGAAAYACTTTACSGVAGVAWADTAGTAGATGIGFSW